MKAQLCLINLTPPSGCSPSPFSSPRTTLHALQAAFDQSPLDHRPSILWAAEGDYMMFAPRRTETRQEKAWDLCLLVHYPSTASHPLDLNTLGHFEDVYVLDLELSQLQHTDSMHSKASAGSGGYSAPKTHTISGYSRVYSMYSKQPRDTPVHMINLLRYKDSTGEQTYRQYLQAAMPCIERYGGFGGYYGRVQQQWVNDSGWDSFFLG